MKETDHPYMNVAAGSTLTVSESIRAGRRSISAPNVSHANLHLNVDYADFDHQGSIPVSPVCSSTSTIYTRIDVTATQAIGSVLVDHNQERRKSDDPKWMNLFKEANEKS